VLDHVSLGVKDVPRAKRFYDAVLGVIGLRPLMDLVPAVGYGETWPLFWINLPLEGEAAPGNGVHVAFRAPTREAVRAFHAAALAAGGSCAGPPDLRPQYAPTYYAAFIRDPDGNKIEAVCFSEG